MAKSESAYIENLTWEIADEIIASHTREHVSSELVGNPLLSVMVLTYQHGAFIRQCMDGILMQETDFPFEIVIGDDGSTDGAFEILLEYQKGHPDRIRLLQATRNLGQYTRSPRLNSLRIRRACRGEFIAFVEGDDFWTDRRKLQRQVDLLRADPCLSGCFHDVEIHGETWKGEQIFVDYGDRTRLTFEDQMTFDTPMATLSIVWRAAAISMPPWALNITFGDRLLMALLTFAGPMARIPEKMGVYRRHPGGITSSGLISGFDQICRVLRMYVEMRRHFGPRGAEFFDYMIRFTIRRLYRLSRRPRWSLGRFFQTSHLMVTFLSPRNWLLVVLEHLGRPSRYESVHATRRRNRLRK